MNERIIKLFMQSVDTNYIPLPIEEHIPSWTEKFAELIIRECITIIEDRTIRQMGEEGVGWTNGYGDGLKTGAWLIKQHFGVEE